MKTLNKIILILFLLAEISWGQEVSSLLSAKVIYASKYGCALNSNVEIGGGTDDGTKLQSAIDFLNSKGGGTLVIDGVALISETLVIKSNVKILVTNGGGVYLADNSNCHMVTTNLTGATISNYNIAIEGGTWNANGTHQDRYEKPSNIGWNYGFWIGSVKGYVLKNIVIKNAKTFGIVISQAEDGYIENLSSMHDNMVVGSSGNNWDGLHLWSTVKNLFVNNFRSNGDDDVLAINTTEGLSSGDPRRGATGDSTINVTIQNVFCDSASNGLRIWDEIAETGLGTSGYIDNLTIKNVFGYIGKTNLQYASMRANKIFIDGWHVQGFNDLSFDPAGTNAIDSLLHLTLNDIDTSVAVVTGNKIKHVYGNYYAVKLEGTQDNTMWQGIQRNISQTGSQGLFLFGGSRFPTNTTLSSFPTDVIPGAGIKLASGAITDNNSGTIDLIAYGKDISTANSISFWRRTGVNTLSLSGEFNKDGKFIVGGNTPVYNNGTASTGITNYGTTSASGIAAVENENSNYWGGQFYVKKIKGTGAVVNTTSLGSYNFDGWDGTNYTTAAIINATVAGSVSSGIVPGKLLFYTRTTGGTLTLAFTLDANQNAAFAGTVTGNSLTRGTNAFTTTAETDTVTISGASVNDFYTITLTGTAAPSANDAVRLEVTATGFVLHRSAAGTSGLTYFWKREL